MARLHYGTTEVVPGVSSGTIAVVLGIYEQLIASINGLSTRKWKQSILFLAPLVIGIFIAVFSIANLIDFLFEHYTAQLFYLFLGLILGVLPFLVKRVRMKQTFSSKHYVILALSFAIIIAFGLWQGVHSEEADSMLPSITTGDYVAIFFAGWVASSAMLLQISGSFILLITGYYRTIIDALSNLHFPVLITLIAGIGVGVLITSKIVHFFLQRFPVGTYAVVIGMVAGSGIIIFPGIPLDFAAAFTSIVAFFVGVIIALLLGRVEHK
ncbi:LOW QUALITY PROTEIN: membrane protein [Geomicrobium sp. JCM 19037]|nr:LOW QUALITY PROTEIN: membrane protein [Geomicrobium sp. JCM 19037]